MPEVGQVSEEINNVWNELVRKPLALQSQGPTRYFSRLAAGAPRMRSSGKRGGLAMRGVPVI